MNTSMKTSTRLGLAATIATLTLAATACGTEQSTASQRTEAHQAQAASPQQRSPMSADAAERAGRQAERERAARAEHADALRAAQGHPTASNRHYPGEEMWLPDGG